MCCNVSQLVIWPHEELSDASYRAVGNPDRCCYCCLCRFAVPHFFTEHPAYRVPTPYTHAQSTDRPVDAAMLAACPSGSVLNIASFCHLE